MLVVAARQIAALPIGLKDSKQLTQAQRLGLIESLLKACEFGEGWVEPEEIDRNGLSQSMRIGVSRALAAIAAGISEEIIMDGPFNFCSKEFNEVTCKVSADRKYPIVSAASVYAKVRRDAVMTEHAVLFAGYGFEKHKGYGTLQHQNALRLLGVCSSHRRTFKPVRLAS